MSPMPADLPPAAPQVSFSQHGPLATAASSWRPYTIKSGDTLYDLAREFDTSVSALVRHNDLSQGGRWIYSGTVIEVPSSKSSSSGSSSQSSSSKSNGSSKTSSSSSGSSSSTKQITVKSGDTLYGLARTHNVTVSAIVKANNISNSRLIYPGQRLSLTQQSSGSGSGSGSSNSGSSSSGSSSSGSNSSGSSSSSSSRTKTVTVKAGDTLWGIANRHGLSVKALQSANSGINPQRLMIGQKVTIPGSSNSSSASRGSGGSSSGSASNGNLSEAWRSTTIGDFKKGENIDRTFLHYTYSSATARAAAANRDHLSAVSVPSVSATKNMIVRTAKRHGVDPKLMLAVAGTESGWNQQAVSPANAIGVMQVIPTTGDWASSLVGRKLNLLDPADNITAGTVVMRALLRAADNENQAIGGYYQGLGGVQTHGMYSDTKRYVQKIKSLRSSL